MKTSFKMILLVWLLNSTCFYVKAEDSSGNEPVLATSDYTIAAYYWPAYHDEPRWRPFFRGTEGEWEIIRNAKPKYENHRQPRVPLWGFEDETEPKVMEKKIEAAVSHGVNTFIFDWYWYEGKPFLEECINDGFLKARNNDKIKFYLMWANHDAKTVWDLERSHNREVIWPGAVDRETFDNIVERVITKYMHHPSYYKINGKPVFSIYQIGTLIDGLGGIKKTREALDYFENQVKKAGFPGLHIQAILWGQFPESVAESAFGDKKKTQNNTVEALGIDSLTNYQFVHLSTPVDDYVEWSDKAISFWPKWEKEFSVPFFPHVSVDWDNNSRFKALTKCIEHGVTPENFAKCLSKAKAYVDSHPSQPALVTINSWNEWSEGSYLEPDKEFGMRYLEAVREVFVEENPN